MKFVGFVFLLFCGGVLVLVLSETSDNDSSLRDKFDDFCTLLSDAYGLDFVPHNMDNYLNILKTPNMRVTEKAALLTEGLKKPSKNEAGISPF